LVLDSLCIDLERISYESFRNPKERSRYFPLRWGPPGIDLDARNFGGVVTPPYHPDVFESSLTKKHPDVEIID
jgi:hypothetical protein